MVQMPNDVVDDVDDDVDVDGVVVVVGAGRSEKKWFK